MDVFNGVCADDLPAAEWVKSSFSGAQGNCVEFAKLADGQIAVRNSRDPHGPALIFTRDEVAAMLRGAKSQEFDRLL